MLKNYLTVLIRNIRRHKGYTFINVAGLAVGMAVSMLMLLFVVNELTYDWCHENGDSVYRVCQKLEMGEFKIEGPGGPGALAPMLKERFPEVFSAARLFDFGSSIIHYEDKSFEQSEILCADPDVFDIFTINTVLGNPATCLEAPFTVIINEEMAGKYFGDADPVGKVLNFDNEYEFTVTGVVRKMPANSHFKFDMLLSFSTLYQTRPSVTGWGELNYYTYIRVPNQATIPGLDEKMTQAVVEINSDLKEKWNMELEIFLQPLRSIHLQSNFIGGLESGGNPAQLWIFTSIAFFILLIACINFMNLSTAQSADRAKEVGMRKILGANRIKLIRQYLSESILFSFISLCLALLLVELLYPTFSQLIGRELTVHPSIRWIVLAGLVGLTLFVGVISGCYPALFLSSFRPLEIIKTQSKTGRGPRLFRNFLVNFQYIISIALICGTLVIYYQLQFVKNYDLGYDQEQVLVIPLSGDEISEKYQVFKHEILQIPGIKAASAASLMPGLGRGQARFNIPGANQGEDMALHYVEVDEGYLETLGISLVAGRNFSHDNPGDLTSSVLVNETLIKEYGLENPVGRIIKQKYTENDEVIEHSFTIIGVVGDYHFRSLREEIQPLLLMMPGEVFNLAAKVGIGNLPNTISSIEAVWNQLESDHPFSYYFLDESFDLLYRTEMRISRVLLAFTVIAISIACLGLFGLASFTAEQRRKEIGIRKVLGATVRDMVLFLSKEWTKWVLLANLIAWPIAWYAMNQWLQTFVYRAPLSPWIFAAGGTIALVIALTTVSYQAIKASTANPINALRYE
jgi:putative ABC transport system permease protein